nr:transcriptional regulator [Sphingomonas jinjuensis]
MKVFLDFEASSLSDHSFPVEVAWVFQDGRSESHLIRPAPDWTDWDAEAEAIHGLSRDMLATDGEPHEVVASRMVEALADHELFASAPSWDGKWLSALLRGAGLPRHALRLRDTDEAMRATATEILQGVVPGARLDVEVHALVAQANAGKQADPAHRALADAQEEYATWCRLRQAARELAGRGADGA